MLNHLITASVLLVSDGPGAAIRDVVITWATPILLLVIAVLAIPHLIKQRFMALGTFALVAIVVFLLFLHPEFLIGIANMFFNDSKASTWGN